MDFMSLPPVKAFLKSLSGVIDYKSRTSRNDFWWAFLILTIIVAVLCFLFNLLASNGSFFGAMMEFLLIALWLIIFIPLSIRRLHDINKPFYWIFIGLLLLIPLLILCAKPGDDGDNDFGSDPNSNFGY